MQLGIVKGQVVSTKKASTLGGMKILIVQPLDMVTFEESGTPVACLDTVGAGEGEVVMLVGGSSARMADSMGNKPTDCCIVAIIDSVDIRGDRVFDKAHSRLWEKQPESIEIEKAEIKVIEELKGIPEEKSRQESVETTGAKQAEQSRITKKDAPERIEEPFAKQTEQSAKTQGQTRQQRNSPKRGRKKK